MSTELLKQMAQSIIDGDSDASIRLAQQSIIEGMDPLTAITDGFVVGVNSVGDAFSAGDAFLPELLCELDGLFIGPEDVPLTVKPDP